MNEGETRSGVRERRSARRFEARHVARLRFVTPLADVRGTDGGGLWPTIICQTRDVCERGLALVVPALREDDENFFGVEGRVRVAVSLPTGVLEVGGVAARYERGGGSNPGSFLVCVEITDEDDPATAAWATFFRGAPGDQRGDG